MRKMRQSSSSLSLTVTVAANERVKSNVSYRSPSFSSVFLLLFLLLLCIYIKTTESWNNVLLVHRHAINRSPYHSHQYRQQYRQYNVAIMGVDGRNEDSGDMDDVSGDDQQLISKFIARYNDSVPQTTLH